MSDEKHNSTGYKSLNNMPMAGIGCDDASRYYRGNGVDGPQVLSRGTLGILIPSSVTLCHASESYRAVVFQLHGVIESSGHGLELFYAEITKCCNCDPGTGHGLPALAIYQTNANSVLSPTLRSS